MPEWTPLTNPPPPNMTTFFVGSSEGGRIDYVFRWPGSKTGFWCKGERGNYPLNDYKPDVWYPGPPDIPGSAVAKFHKTGDPNDLAWR